MTAPFKADPARVRGLLVGAAVGDALGWPQEDRNNIIGGARARKVDPQSRFRAWRRNAGTQYARYEDPVREGEYSDDTQLLLAVARACMRGDDWLRWMTEIELPTWLLYQRGGGRALLTASRAWADGHPPWAKDSDRVTAYFNAGANGVAMRIAPHAVATAEDPDPRRLLDRIVADGLGTHGHPRALVGACIHGLAIRHALARRGTLGYGDLIHSLLDDASWRDDTLLDRAAPTDWHDGFRSALKEDPSAVWKTTADEVTDLLLLALEALQAGAMANDDQVLERMGCFDRKRNGAGTVSAAAALYLTARSAARPMSGLLRAAFVQRADTDTLASMTASLLGAVHEVDWLGPLATAVQDSPYISEVAHSLTQRANTLTDVVDEAVDQEGVRKALTRLRADLGKQEASMLLLPDGRPVEVVERHSLATKANAMVERVVGRTVDGQTLAFDKLSRGRKADATRSGPVDAPRDVQVPAALQPPPVATDSSTTAARIMSVRLKVRDLGRASGFYADTFGLTSEPGSDKTVLAGSLILQRARPDESVGATNRVMVTIGVRHLGDVVKRLDEAGYFYEPVGQPDQKQIWLRDLDGNPLHVCELSAGGGMA